MGLRRRDREGGRRDWATDRTAADSGRLPGRETGLVRPTKLTSRHKQYVRVGNAKK